jgi:acyl-CoA dehydrogenase
VTSQPANPSTNHPDDDTFAALLDAVDRFVRDRLVPMERQVDEDDAVPAELVAEMRELGLFGLTAPPDYGGLGVTCRQECELMMVFGRTSPAFRSVFGTNIGIGARGLILAGTEEQKQRWLTKLASGEMIGSFALTEPEAGSDAAGLRTTARLDGDHYVLNGGKRYITNAPVADLFTVMARSEDKPGAAGISSFLVPADLPGLTVGKPDRKMGQRGAKTADVTFDNVRVPVENRLGAPGEGFSIAMRVLDRGRLNISATAVGNAGRLVEEGVRYAAERRQFGKPIGDFQLVQALIADCEVERLAAQALVRASADAYDRDGKAILEASASKLYATEMVGRVADRIVQVFGGAGYMAEYPIERFYRDVRLLRLYEGTSQIQQLVIARELAKRHGVAPPR